MFTSYRYKNLPERQLQEIITYCLTYELDFKKWHVGLTEDSEVKTDHIIQCDSAIEAKDLKRYLTTIRGFNDEGGEGIYIYIFREKD